MCSPLCRVWFHSTIWLVETDRLSCDQRVDGSILNSAPRGQTGLFHLYLRLLMASWPTCPKSPRPLAASEATSLISASFAFRLISCICDQCPRWERNLKIQTILPLALASLVFGCGGQMSSNEAGLLDAVAFIIGGQQEGAIPQGFETHWRRTVHGREIKYQSIGPYVGFGQVSTPEQNCIGLPEQKYISDAGKKGPRTGGLFLRHHAWFGLSAGMSELARRELRLL